MLEPLTKKLGRVNTHAVMVAIMAMGYFGIVYLGSGAACFTGHWSLHLLFFGTVVLEKNVVMLYSMMCILSLGWAAVVSLPFAMMTDLVNKKLMGLFMGIFNLSVVVPQLVASWVIGSVVRHAGDKSIVFIISGISLAVSAGLWLLVSEKKKSLPVG